MRILVPELASRDQHAGFFNALMTASLASPFSPFSVMTRRPSKPGASLVNRTVGIDREGNSRVDSAVYELARVLHPDVEVLAAVARRGVHEARAGAVVHMLAFEQRHGEVVAAASLQRVIADQLC